MVWRVVATQQGQYNQVIMDEGVVFDLLLHEDGTYPKAMKYTPKKDTRGKVIEDEYDEEVILGADGKPIHLHFAEDQGVKPIKRGPKKGEVMRFGWMTRVPDRTPIGQYPVGTDFWSANVQLPQAIPVIPSSRERGPEDHRRNHARILDVLPKEAEAA